jgi:spore coat protein A
MLSNRLSGFRVIALAIMLFSLAAISTQAQFPGSGQVPISPMSVLKFVDPLPHFAYPGARVDATNPGTPLTIEMTTVDEQAISTGTMLPNGVTVSPTAGLTHVWGYRISNGTVSRGPHWPAYTIVAKRGVPLDVLYLNNITESYSAVNIAVDQTLHWAIMNYSFDPYLGDVPLVPHLHGGEVPSWSDGGPDAWFTPNGGMGGNGALTNVYHYPNTQEPATLWIHDHALGLTRVNVYAGLAGFYFLKDDSEDLLHLPGWSGDNMVQEIDKISGLPHGDPYLPEVEVVVQDRMFDQNGQLYFPAGIPGGAPNPTVHPFWIPEFVGDIVTVNGKTWPYMSVAPRKYRFRFLNGSNARFYELWLQNLPTGIKGPIIWQIGTDGGLLDAPVAIDPNLGGKLLMAPGERFDLVIDFGSVPNPDPASPYAVWTIRNSGRTPYDKGAPPNGSTMGQILQFVVDGQLVGDDNSVITGRTTPLEKLADFNTGLPLVPFQRQRQLTLNEVMGLGGPLEVLVNNTKWGGHSTRPYDDFVQDPYGGSNNLFSEIMTEGQTEVWQIINLTADAHPIHLHLVQFQLLSRQNFNTTRYNKVYNAAFVAGGNPLGFVGGWGPPLNYFTGNDTSGVNWTPYLGGNPNVTPYLQNGARPALPNERGWKDTFIMLPGQVTTVIARWTPTDATASGHNYFDFDPSVGPGYVWHCHIIDHEDNEMMRPYAVNADGPAGRLEAPPYPGYNFTHPFDGFARRGGNAPSEPVAIPASFVLSQNYPNPFNARTLIQYSLPQATHVSLDIYDILGRKVRNLVDSDQEPGQFQVSVNAGDFASGVYFYKLQAGDFSETKRMSLLK